MFSLFKNKSEEVSGCDPRTEPTSISNMYIPDIKVVFLDVAAVAYCRNWKVSRSLLMRDVLSSQVEGERGRFWW